MTSVAGAASQPAVGLTDRFRQAHPECDVRGAGAVRRWTINGDFLGLKATGVARFGREVTLALDNLIGEGHPLTENLVVDLVAPGAPRDPLALRHIATSIVSEFRPRLPQVWVQFQLPRRVSGGLLSFCNLAPIFVDRHIVCIHDLQTMTVPESYGRFFRLAHRVILPRIGRRADVVTTVSEFSKANLVRFGIAPASEIAVVYNGSDHALRWRPELAVAGLRSDRPFVLCIGRNEGHKNLRLVWRMARALDDFGIDIVVVGDFDPGRLDGDCAGRPRNIRCLGRVSDDDLSRGLREALCFAFPSRTEGFGLPAIEAMASGCPVVASWAPCLPEICGTAALFADPDDPQAWTTAIRNIHERSSLRQSLRDAGWAQSDRYSWRETALAYLRLMLEVDLRRDGSGTALPVSP